MSAKDPEFLQYYNEDSDKAFTELYLYLLDNFNPLPGRIGIMAESYGYDDPLEFIHDLCLHIYKRLDSYTPDNFKNWIEIIMANYLKDKLDARRRRSTLPYDIEEIERRIFEKLESIPPDQSKYIMEILDEILMNEDLPENRRRISYIKKLFKIASDLGVKTYTYLRETNEELPYQPLNPLAGLEREEYCEYVMACLKKSMQKLDDICRKLLTWKKVKKKSVEEIKTILNKEEDDTSSEKPVWDERKIYNKIYRCKEALKGMLSEYGICYYPIGMTAPDAIFSED
jgi:RNA polymerase sigma factor (sigma-70 family)